MANAATRIKVGQKQRKVKVLFAAFLTTTTMLAATSVLAGPDAVASAAVAGSNISATSWLSSIPDTAAFRTQIAVNDLRTMWKSAGVAPPATLAQLSSGVAGEAMRQIAAGSPLGTAQWAFGRPHALGYQALAITAEVLAGVLPAQLSLVQGPIDASKVGAVMGRLGVRPASAGAVYRYVITKPADLMPEGAAAALSGVRNLAVLGGGGRAAAGGPDVPPRDVTNLLQGRHLSHSLASDPEVSQALRLLKGADVMWLGTGLVSSWEKAIGSAGTPLERQRMEQEDPGLSRLRTGPTLGGYGYLPGDPAHPRALVVAVYPSASAAKVAAGIMGPLLRSGTSVVTNEKYARVFRVDTVTVHGAAVVARLTEHTPGAIAEEVENYDMPLFWGPVKKG